MFSTLLESAARPQPHRGGSMVSLVAHVALIAAAVFATARETISAPVREPPVIIRFIPPPEPVTPPPSEPMIPRPVSQTVAPAPTLPAFLAPTIVPQTIPPIDLTAVPTSADFSEIRSHGPGDRCVGPCPRVGLGAAGDGEAPVWAVNDIMMQLREAPVPPRYPEQLRRAGVDGSVLVKFVVDTLGRIDPASVEVLRSTHDLFTVAVRESLARLRFRPAIVGARKVPAAAVMPFQFTLK
jgi:protein TonB